MKINQDQLMVAFDKYFENELLRKAPSGLEKFKLGFIYGKLKNKMPDILSKIKENDFIDIFDENDFIDIDDLFKYSKDSIDKVGKIVIGGIMFNEDDLNTIYRYMKEV